MVYERRKPASFRVCEGWIWPRALCNRPQVILLPQLRNRTMQGFGRQGLLDIVQEVLRTMTSLIASKTRISLLSASVAGVVAAIAVPAGAQEQQPQIPQGWFKACSKQQDVDVCNVQNIVTASTGQLVTGVSMIELKGKVNRKVFQVTVPTGRLMPPGIGLQVDNGKTQKLEYMICFPDRCVAEGALERRAGRPRSRRARNLTLTSVNFQNQPNPMKVTLQGFTGAYDGAPLQAGRTSRTGRRSCRTS
jgi:invasion protein IalB